MSAYDEDLLKYFDYSNEYELINTDPVIIKNVEVVLATEKALLCSIENIEYWIPRSQIYKPDPHEKNDNIVSNNGDIGILIIPKWLADKKCIYYDMSSL